MPRAVRLRSRQRLVNQRLAGRLAGFLRDLSSGITADPSTWPSGDPIWSIAQAIAFAEGANVLGARPDRNNNPGDLTRGDEHGEVVAGYDGSFIVFASKQDGWQALYLKLANIAQNSSARYNSGMSWAQIGQIWAGGDPNWAMNVAANLGVDPNSSLGDFVGSGGSYDAGAPDVPVYASAPTPPTSSSTMTVLTVGAAAVGLAWLINKLDLDL